MLVEHPTKQIVEHFESKFVNNEDQPAVLLLEEGYSERERKVIIMMIGATGHTLAPERIPQELSRHLIDLMAQQKMLPETLHMLELCNSDDALVVMGSDIQLRLSILAIDEGLHDAIGKSDSEHPPKYFECLLERFDSLLQYLPDTDESIIAETWPSMRAAIVRQAALSCVKAKGKLYADDGEVDWSAISLETYLEYVDQILPQVDEDTDKLDDEEQMANAKERRNLTDIFLEKRRVVNGVKIRTLLKENRLATFEENLKAFTRRLDAALLPTPKLVQRYSVVSLLDEDVGTAGHERQGRTDEPQASSRVPKPSAESPAGILPKRKRAEKVQAEIDAPESAQALAKANEHLQREMTGHPGTVPEALAISETVPHRRTSAKKNRSAATGSAAAESSERPVEPARKRALVTRSSPGEQVDFDDSQSVDDPPEVRRATLVDRPLPRTESPLASPFGASSSRASSDVALGTARRRVPWSEEEVNHLQAAVLALGRGKWKQALALYKFRDCRTAVDLKDKWRNLNK